MKKDKKKAKAFAFTEETLAQAQKIMGKYPAARRESAVLPLLELAQRQNGNWLSQEALEAVARILGMPPMKVYEVASFYTMFNLAPVGKHVIEICGTPPCALCGSGEVAALCEKKLGIKMGETTKDGQFTLREAECLGACVNAPVVRIGDDYYEDLTPEAMEKILSALKAGKKPTAGSQKGRRGSCAEGGSTSLKEKT